LPKTLTIGIGDDARTIAVRQRRGTREAGNPGKGPNLFWLGGFKSDMRGTKAEALDAWGAAHHRAVTRFDYSGHGESGGSFLDGSIGRWLEESLAVYRQFCRGPQVVIGSSMGGWLALLLAQALREQGNGAASNPHGEEPRSGVPNHEVPSAPIAGMVLIAPAVDFTEVLMWEKFDAEVKREIKLKGAWSRPSQYSDEPYVITRKLIEEGRKHLLLDGVIETGCPVRILQGVQDPDVPWQHAAELVSRFVSDDVVFTLIKDGDHRLSRPEDIERLLSAVAEF
jgi:pimeloyl-ACP methyl ester carboxylesterase